MRFAKHFWVVSALAGISLLMSACGEEDGTAEKTTADTAALVSKDTAEEADGVNKDHDAENEEDNAAVTQAGCAAFTKDLLQKWNLDRQKVLGIASNRGKDLKSMKEVIGWPDPDLFRQFAAAFAGLDLSGAEATSMYQKADVVAADMHKTADLLEAALAASDNPEAPAWTALQEFYTMDFFMKHNMSFVYYFDHAGCDGSLH